MNEHMNTTAGVSGVGAVVVAAGMSSRMGAYKPLLEIEGVSVARRVIGALAGAGAGPIVVVTGHRAADLEAHLSERSWDAWGEAGLIAARGARPPRGLLFVKNENYAATPMFESAKLGLSYIAGMCERTFFCPIDVPLFTAATAHRLTTSGAPIVKPVYKGKEGHPILIDVKLIPMLIESDREHRTRGERIDKAGGLKSALAEFENLTMCVEVDDEGILYDADTPEDMRKLREWANRL